MADPRVRQMTIKTNVVKRLIKDKLFNKKEIEQELKRLEKFKADNEDEYKIRKQDEVVQESQMMVPETNRKLKAARDDLKNFLDAEADMAETEAYKEAGKQLEEAQKEIELE